MGEEQPGAGAQALVKLGIAEASPRHFYVNDLKWTEVKHVHVSAAALMLSERIKDFIEGESRRGHTRVSSRVLSRQPWWYSSQRHHKKASILRLWQTEEERSTAEGCWRYYCSKELQEALCGHHARQHQRRMQLQLLCEGV
jgi:hypothetical protein